MPVVKFPYGKRILEYTIPEKQNNPSATITAIPDGIAVIVGET